MTCIKPFKDIPSKLRWTPIPWGLIFEGGSPYLHRFFDKRHRELGPILRERLGSDELVSLADPKLIQATIANEGQYPRNKIPPVWSLYNRVHDIERGLFFQNGESWLRLRKALNGILLDSSKVNRFGQDILSINFDMFNEWTIKHANDDTLVIDTLNSDLCKWSIEAVGFMLFGQRLGCISSTHVSRSSIFGKDGGNNFVDTVVEMFALTSKFQTIPCEIAYKLNLPIWRRFDSTMSRMIKLATSLCKIACDTVCDSKHLKKSLLQEMLESDNLTCDEVHRTMADLIIAAADTTAASLNWALYLLAKHPEIQERIMHETEPYIKGKLDLGEMSMKSPILKGFVRETLRLYPIAPFMSRTLDKDIVLAGYRIPAETLIVFSLYTTSRMSECFESPLELLPERWIRSKNSGERNMQASASLPFGLGSRMCIGRKMALLEMHLFVASFVNRFKFELVNNSEVEIRLNMTSWPDEPIKLNLWRR